MIPIGNKGQTALEYLLIVVVAIIVVVAVMVFMTETATDTTTQGTDTSNKILCLATMCVDGNDCSTAVPCAGLSTDCGDGGTCILT